MTKTKLFVRLLQHAALAGAVLLLLPAAAAAQRGASGPPEHAAVDPINDGPNPYETIRDWGTLPDGRSWGSVSAVNVDIDGVHIWAGDRCGVNSCAESDVDPTRSMRTAASPPASAVQLPVRRMRPPRPIFSSSSSVCLSTWGTTAMQNCLLSGPSTWLMIA